MGGNLVLNVMMLTYIQTEFINELNDELPLNLNIMENYYWVEDNINEKEYEVYELYINIR